ncbi:MAG: RluA family pseudouridine synthase [Pseudomonadota bacterium]
MTVPGPATLEEPPPYLIPHNPAPVRIVFADTHLLLIEKPDLLLSVPGRHPLNRDCMISRLQQNFADALVVHRLDLDTSGVMVVARGKAMQCALSKLFQERKVDKEYRAWVAGEVRRESGSIDLPIARDWINRPRQKICAASGKSALTHYRVIERRDGHSLLSLTPVTGRSHQLRIHLREIGHPILGCDLYAPPAVLGAAPRLMLHAARIAFHHPATGLEIVGHSRAPF